MEQDKPGDTGPVCYLPGAGGTGGRRGEELAGKKAAWGDTGEVPGQKGGPIPEKGPRITKEAPNKDRPGHLQTKETRRGNRKHTGRKNNPKKRQMQKSTKKGNHKQKKNYSEEKEVRGGGQGGL